MMILRCWSILVFWIGVT